MRVTKYVAGMRVAEKGKFLDDVRRVGRDIEMLETCDPHPIHRHGET